MKIAEVISSRQNVLITSVSKLSQKKYRDIENIFVFEGIKLAKEALVSGVNVPIIFLREEESQNYIDELEKLQREAKITIKSTIYIVKSHVYEKISQESGSQGILCVAKYLDNFHNIIKIITTDTVKHYKNEKIMMLWSVRDPGNLGAIIRSAGAFGIDRIILSNDCADIYNIKTIRGAMGALFRQKITIVDDFVGTIEALKTTPRRVIATGVDEKSIPLDRFSINSTDCIIIGNEGHGIDPAVVSHCEASVFLPIAQTTESLNASVAASIFMWELSRLKTL